MNTVNTQSIKLQIEIPNLDPYSSRQWNADVFCECCGRGIANRKNTFAVDTTFNKEDNTYSFKAIDWNDVKGRDPVEWGGFIGSHCAKQLPKTHKISMKRIMKHLV